VDGRAYKPHPIIKAAIAEVVAGRGVEGARKNEMKSGFSVVLALAGCLAVCLAVPLRISAQSPASGDGAGSGSGSGQSKSAGEGQKPTSGATQSASDANAFPEDTSSVPVMPTKVAPTLPEGSSNGLDNGTDNGRGLGRAALPSKDTDPIRTPDDPAPVAASGVEEGSSSSLKGMDNLLPPPDSDQSGKKRKQPVVKQLTHKEVASKDIEIGSYYLDKKNWKAALSRFESALVLDPENPEVYWGLAEAEARLGKFADARAHYLTLLEFDPDGPHGRQARKAMKDPAIANGKNSTLNPLTAETPK